jgi:HAD superfamily hydrolase (TIGR01490 family)
MIAALFDFDGTLYTGHIWQDLVRHHWNARRHRRWVVAYLSWNMAPLPLYKTGLLSSAAFFRTWGKTMSWLLRNWTLDEAQALFETLIEEQIVPNLRSDVLDRLRQHEAQGHLVALVSGTFAPFLEMIAQRMDVPHAIGTPLAVRDGRYTGRIVPPLCQSEVEWMDSHAYADRNTDIPLLSLVGRPVAVYPDEALLAHAQELGWPVIGQKSP